MLADGSAGGRMLASGSADDIVAEAPPHRLLNKPCGEGMPWAKEYHKWSWTKACGGARVEFKSGEWHHKWLTYELCRHGLVMSVGPRRSKLKKSKKSDHESDTNYYCWLTDPEPASGGSGNGWAALFGYSRHNDKPGNTHGWVQFGKKCSDNRLKKLTVAVFLECFGFEPDSIEDAVVLRTWHWRRKQKQPASGGLQEQSSPPAASTGGQQPASGGLQEQSSPPAASTGGQGVGPTAAAPATSSAGQQPTAPAMTQHQQQPQPSSGGQGLALTAAAGISAAQPP